MKKNKRMKVAIGVIFLCIGVVACKNQTTEKPVENTPTPTVAPMATIAPTVTPTLTPAPIEGVEISEENFGDEDFCFYLRRKFDADKNGYFSDEELKEVKAIDLAATYVNGRYTEIKGFSNFPELERLSLNSTYKAEIRNVPKLSEIWLARMTGATKYELGTVCIEDCQNLTSVDIMDTVFIGTEENETGEFKIARCPMLQSVSVYANQLDKVGIQLTETPMAELSVFAYEDESEPKFLVLDTNVYQHFCLPVYEIENRKLVMTKPDNLTWVGDMGPSLDAELQEMAALAEKVQEGFFFEVQKVQPSLQDEEGKTGYLVHLDNRYLSDENYSFRTKRSSAAYGEYSEYENCILVFSEEPLRAEQFSIEWDADLQIESRSYSPLLGIKGFFFEVGEEENGRGLTGDIVYTFGEQKDILRGLDVFLHYSVGKDGGFEVWTDVVYEGEAETNVTEGFWPEGYPAEAVPKEDEIPIDETFFTNIIFRNYIKEALDLDRNGCLSVEEREAVTELVLYDWMGPCVVDGFEYFSNLQKLDIGWRDTIADCRNCPNLQMVEIENGQKLTCKNCPKLESIAIYENEDAEVVTEDCPMLKSVTKGGERFTCE